jgi:DNA-binding transcriptional ArsR family regulator
MSERRPATAEEAKALAHPLRLRILRLCLDDERTNKELAEALGKDPGTVLHHVRVLVDGGFLRAGAPRRGTRGAREKPYRATGKSWQLDFREHKREADTTEAMADAFAAELREAVAALGQEALLDATRMGIRLRPEDRDELLARLGELRDEFFEREHPDGEPLALFLALHRRP